MSLSCTQTAHKAHACKSTTKISGYPYNPIDFVRKPDNHEGSGIRNNSTLGGTDGVNMVFSLAMDEKEVLPGQGMEEAVDRLRAMLRQEQTHYSSCPDYLKAGELCYDPLKVISRWRLKICEWIFEVVDHFGFERDAAATALNYLDRSVAAASEATGLPVSKREYQLYAVTSLYIAVKLHGEVDEAVGSRKKLKITAFQELSRGFFTVETIETNERRILSLLNWHMNPPTASQFLSQLLRLLPQWSTQESILSYEAVVASVVDIAKYLTELSVCDESFSFESTPAFVAYASLLCAFDAIRDTMPLPHEVIAKFLCNVAVASEVLLPGLETTMLLQQKLKDIAPSLFPQAQPTLVRSVSFEETEIPGRSLKSAPSTAVSPTSFFDGATGGSDHRKRARTKY
jgi:hypothetical protein